MTKAETVMLVIAIATIATVFAIGIEKAYAAEFTYEPSFDWDTSECKEYNHEGLDRAICVIKQTNTSGYTGNQTDADNDPVFWSEILEKYITPEQFEAEAKAFCKSDLTCPAGNFEKPDGTIINYDDIIEEGKKILADQTPDDELVFSCANDISLYQGGMVFDVPVEIWIDGDGHRQVRLYEDDRVKTDNFTTDEDLAVEACFGQWRLEVNDNISVRTIVPNVDDYFPYHADVAYGKPPVTQDIVNHLENKDRPDNLSMKNIVCNGWYDIFYKRSFVDPVTGQGCFDNQELEHDASKQPDMEIYNEIEEQYKQFLIDPTEALAKIKQELRDEFNRNHN